MPFWAGLSGWIVAFAWALAGGTDSRETTTEREPPKLDLSKVVAIDVETTGLRAHSDRIVELALVGIADDGQVIWTWQSLFNPGRAIPPETSAIHGIGDDRVRNAPEFAEKADEISAQLEKKILLAHNLKFDVGFLKEELRRCGRDLPATHGFDTLRISRQVDRSEKSHKLGDACRRYGIELRNAHRATDDTIAAAQLLVAMHNRHGGRSAVFAPEKLA